MPLRESDLVTDLKWDVQAALPGALWYKVHDASRKGVWDAQVTWRGYTSFIEAKYVRDGEDARAVINESRLQLATLHHAQAASQGRAFYAVWVREGREWRSELWLPNPDEIEALGVYRAQLRMHPGVFENGLFIERLRAQHRAEWKL